MQNLTYKEAKKLIKENKQYIFLDVRSPLEYKEGHIDGAISIPLYELECKINKILPDKNKGIILYCMTGSRSKLAYEKLKKIGYENIYNLENGLQGVYYRKCKWKLVSKFNSYNKCTICLAYLKN